MNKETKNLFLAIILSTLTVIAWQYFYENPKKAAIEKHQAKIKIEKEHKKKESFKKIEENSDLVKAEAIHSTKRLEIKTNKLKGSIALKGLRFDDLELVAYKENLNPDSPSVKLFSHHGMDVYFAEFGWIKQNHDQDFAVPDKNSLWQCDSEILSEEKPVNCTWVSNKVKFETTIQLDHNYMFDVTQSVTNFSQQEVNLASYSRVYKAKADPKNFAIIHEGAIGVFKDTLKEATFEDLSKQRQDVFNNSPGSWLGFTSKYWLSAIIPDSKIPSKSHFIATKSSSVTEQDSYNVNFVTDDITVNPGEQKELKQMLFAGAKEEKLLEKYSIDKNISLFDRAVDYGLFYFITKPLLWLISYFYSLLGNFGLAIVFVTLTLKLLMFPFASKSFSAMNKMKEIQPKLEKLKQSCGEDKIKFNQAVMELYKKEKVNPAAGCLPLIIQIPLFFSLYKVILISLEMRHAPFYGWIKDLSASDPTSIWNLFGLLPWGPLGNFDIGVWPLIMALTMFLQQKLSPAPADPVQATLMKFMPLLLLVMLYSLPSGLMIYWSFSNILSILQQFLIATPSKNK
jgi:YidC/Oxa1 family membrane protein insertase